MAATSSNLNRFSKFFYHWKESEISNKIHVITSQHTLSLRNLNVQICRKSARNCKQKMPHKPVKFPQLSEEKTMNNL